MKHAKPTARDIFDHATEISSPDARLSYVAEACGDDADLRQRVDALLAAYERAGSFLETPAAAPAAAIVEGLKLGATSDWTTDPAPPPLREGPGSVIGPYKLLAQVGEGGMGVVFLAEQIRPVRRQVALKVVKAGMDTRQVVARFEAERQALALMDHPCIAKVFDGGATDSGRPYFVMELVKGIPITRYCDEQRLKPHQRLELFVHVCSAVQHAHTKGVIHRDIKPTNVLVALYDGKPVPKVIDFGVAKATGQRLTERTMFTGLGAVVGTPQYMSPEQAEMNQLDIDTRSDVYSLGVLLYELLTGTTPIEHKRVREAALLEVLRVIREEEPPRPSTRLTTIDQLPSVAAQRGVEPAKLTGIVRGELDWIVMKALEKDRNRRYETANGFARDVERYLRDEAVGACPPSVRYRLGKLVRRNRVAVMIVAMVIVGLSVLVGVLAVSNRMIATQRNAKADALREKEAALVDAETQRRRAEANFVRARVAVRELVMDPARGVGEWSRMPPDARKMFAHRGIKLYEGLLQEDSSDPAMRYESAVAYRQLGVLYDKPLAEYDKARQLLEKSIAILEELSRDHPGAPEYRQQLAWSSFLIAHNALHMKRPNAQAIAAFQRASALYEALHVADPANLDYVGEMIPVYQDMAELLITEARPADAERAVRRGIALYERYLSLAGKAPDNRARPAYGLLVALLLRQQRYRELVDATTAALNLEPDIHDRWYGAAAVYLAAGDTDAYRGACAQLLDRFDNQSPNRPELAERTAKACALGPGVPGFDRVEALANRAVTGTEAHPFYRNFVLAKGMCEYRVGRPRSAIEWLRRFDPRADGIHWDGIAFAFLAMAHHSLGERREAVEALGAARAIVKKEPADMDAPLGWCDWLHCNILCREAEQFLAATAATAPATKATEPEVFSPPTP